MEKTVFVISLDTDIQRLLPKVDKNGNPIPDNVFKDKEQGEIIINTTGFVDKLEIVFDTEIKKLAEKQGYEFKDDVVIPLPNNGGTKNTHIRTIPSTYPDTLKAYRLDEYFFYVPDGTWKPYATDIDENTHYVVIRAYKEDKVLSNVLVIGGAGDDGEGPVTDDYLEVEGRLETELRTRIREKSN